MTAIHVLKLSKQYQIGATQGICRYRTFREALTDAAAAPVRRMRRLRGQVPEAETIWALRDVDLEVQRGEVVGIIGRNGAGKSTLLKILSRITHPTSGRVEIRGRLASLLEVGTGFHPELTGRENIFLNGAILGMRRSEISRKFDEIVAFAEVEKFIDTPVKRYSSGMYLRLAFAVAAHLEPEILVVDEVLAVGDAEFQKKCLGKMGDVARQGRTVLFVSHQLAAVKSLCSRVVQIHRGTVVRDGEPTSVVHQYLTDGSSELTPERVWPDSAECPGNPQCRLRALRVVGADGQLNGTYPSSQPIIVEMEFDLTSLHPALCVGLDVINRDGVVVFRSMQNDRHEREWPVLKIGWNRLRCVIPPGLLNYGAYFVAPKIGLHAMAWILNGDAEVGFEVQLDHSESPFWNMTHPEKFVGVIAPCLRWQAAEGQEATDEFSTTVRPAEEALT
jgi:lipopolysaccharide transport system ATP-binding protein